MDSKITISGEIISELSDKIPSNIIALNELIKNSYDAGASTVNIQIDSKSKTLTITDDGSGMDKNDIDKLFHIAKSDKKYGEKNAYNRYTQGSKGLGFLSVFKFGKGHVSWRTKKSEGLEFSLNYDSLINSDDISKYSVGIKENNNIKKGTEIIINLDNYNLNSLLQYLNDEKNYLKIINAFRDEDFIINLNINDKKYSSSSVDNIIEILPERQLFYVTYDSSEEKIKYYCNNVLAKEIDYKFNSKLYKLKMELIIFQLKTHQKKEITKLFYNTQDELTPIIYTNSNLFNNYELFNPNITRSIKLSKALNQIIGYVEIFSSDSMMSFNSDRSQFLQNELTDSIKDFLQNINIKIQDIGSSYKNYLINLDFLKSDLIEDLPTLEEYKEYIKDDFKFKDKVIITKEEKCIVFSIFNKKRIVTIGKKNEPPKVKPPVPPAVKPPIVPPVAKPPLHKKTIPAILNLKMEKSEINVPSQQIDLKSFISIVKDSGGNDINLDLIKIKVDDAELDSNILSSVTEPCIKLIQYSYNDPVTGMVTKNLTLIFNLPEIKVNGLQKNKECLITLPASKTYTINFNIYVSNLINQINSLNFNEYKELIACSLRAIFEISVDEIIKSGKFNHLSINNIKELEIRVQKVIEYIKNDKKIVGEIATNSKINYTTLKNILDPNEFKERIFKAHLGAHKSVMYLDESEIKGLAHKAGVFVVIVNEMINNVNIK